MKKERTCILQNSIHDLGTNPHDLSIALATSRDADGNFIVPGCDGVVYVVDKETGACGCISYQKSRKKLCQHNNAAEIAKRILERLSIPQGA